MSKKNASKDLLPVNEIFRDHYCCVLVPDNVNPEEMLNLFDQPEKLTILINYDVPIICLEEYSEAVIELLGELENDILQPINGVESETPMLN